LFDNNACIVDKNKKTWSGNNMIHYFNNNSFSWFKPIYSTPIKENDDYIIYIIWKWSYQKDKMLFIFNNENKIAQLIISNI